MMVWIESHRALAGHPKTKRLARRLGISVPAAIGHLHLLWWWASAYAEEGDLSPFGIDEIEAEAMWDGEPGAFMAALEDTGLIDHEGDGLVVHDWYTYWGKYDDRKRANAERQARHRANRKAESLRDDHVTVMSQLRNGATVQYKTIQDIQEPAAKITSIDSARAKELTEGFEDFYRAYPRKVGKSAASKSWFTLKPNAEMRATILAALEQHKASRDWQKDGGQYVPHPATWLNGKRWLDELEHAPTNPNRVFGGDGRLAL